MRNLPPTVIQTDHRLNRAHESAAVELAKHRWHWTLDESNPRRVPVAEYARQVERSRQQIGRYAHGYARWIDNKSMPFTECLLRASMSEPQEAAVEAVAAEAGKTFSSTANSKEDRATVKQVLTEARIQAEVKGTPVREEIPKVAKNAVERARVLSTMSDAQVRTITSPPKPSPRPQGTRDADGQSIPVGLIHTTVSQLNRSWDMLRGLSAAALHPDEVKEAKVSLRQARKSYQRLGELLDLMDRYFEDDQVDWDAELQKLVDANKEDS